MGRQAELSTLRFALGRVRGGERKVIHLTGEPGVGKTWIAHTFADEVAASGVPVHRARVWEWGGAPALFPWLQIMRDLQAQTPEEDAAAPRLEDVIERLSAGDSVGDGESSPADRFLLFDDVAAILSELSSESPRLLYIDDVHAADPSSLHLLRFVTRDTRPARLLVVCTRRDAEMRVTDGVRALLAELDRDVERVGVGGLRAADLTVLIESIAGETPSEAIVERVRDATGGNPLFVDGLVRAAMDNGGLSALATRGVPDDLRATLERRLSVFGGDASRVLAAAAALGRATSAALLSRITGVDEPTIVAICGRAVDERVMRCTSDGASFSFVHSLLEETAHERVPPRERMALHLSIAEALSGSTALASAAELARHFLAAGPEGRARGVRHALDAGDRAMQVFAYEEAADAYDRARAALAMIEDADLDLVARASIGLGNALRMSGRTSLARATLRRVEQLDVSPERVAEAALGMAATTEFAIPDREVVELLAKAYSGLPEDALALRIRIRMRQVMEQWSDRVPDLVRAWSDEALALARESGDPRLLVSALASVMTARWGPTGLGDRRRLLPEMARAAKSTGDPRFALEVERWRLNVAWELGDRAAARAALERYGAVADEMRSAQYQMNAALRRAVEAEAEGDLEELERQREQIVILGERASDPQASFYDEMIRAHVAWERCDRPACEELCPRVLSAPLVATGVLPVTAGIRAELARRAGNDAEAQAELRRALDDLDHVVPDSFGAISGLCFLAEVAYQLGDSSAADALHTRLAPHAELYGHAGLGVSRGSVHRYLGMLETLRGDADAAEEHFALAVEANERAGARRFAALSLVEHARLLRGRGDERSLAEAAALEEQAATIAAEIGAPLIESFLAEVAADERPPREVRLRPTNAGYVVSAGEETIDVKKSRGLTYLALLLSRPGDEIHSAELASGQSRPAAAGVGGNAGEVLDEKAARAYRARLEEIAVEVEEARKGSDGRRVVALRREAEFLAKQLGAGLGLGGRPRKSADVNERARSAVTRAIRRAIERLGQELPELAEHLQKSVTTGTYCRYSPTGTMRVVVEEA